MQSVGFCEDFSSRGDRYGRDQWQCPAVSFSVGNAFFAATTGVIGGFALGAAPAVLMQAGVAGLIAHRQAKATYHGQGYSAPPRWLAYANWATAGILVCGAVAARTPLAIPLAILPAVVYTKWGWGHWDLHHMLDRSEKLRTAGREQGLHEHHIEQTIATDPHVARRSTAYQIRYGIADIGAVVAGALKGETPRLIAIKTLHGLVNFGSMASMVAFGTGLAKSFSKTAARLTDRATPRLARWIFGTHTGEITPNRHYAAGYLLAGMAPLTETVMDLVHHKPVFVTKVTCLTLAYTAWARAYFALDELKAKPESADQFRARITPPPVPG